MHEHVVQGGARELHALRTRPSLRSADPLREGTGPGRRPERLRVLTEQPDGLSHHTIPMFTTAPGGWMIR